MHQSRILSSLILSLVMATPACGAKFVSLGDEDAGLGEQTLSSGGSSGVGVGGSSSLVGAGGSGECVCTSPAPKIANYACADGSMGGPVCERDVVDACSWFIRECPVILGNGGAASVGGASAIAGSVGVAGGRSVGGSGGFAGGVAVAGSSGSAGGVAVAGSSGFAGGVAVAGSSGFAGGVAVAGSSGFAGGVDVAGSSGFAGGVDVAGSSGFAGGGAVAGAGGYNCVCTGDAPKMANYTCPDGSIAGPVCDRDVVDACNWFIRTCPPTPGVGGAGAGGAASVGGSSSSVITCEYNGVVYSGDQEFPSTDGCNYCGCTPDGLVACTFVYCVSSCDYNGVVYAKGQTFSSTDGCNTCTCTVTGVSCTTLIC